MEKETILDLYYGRLNPMDMEIEEKEEYERHCRKVAEKTEQFRKLLSPEQQEAFQKLCDAELQADEILHRDAFVKGFRVGMKLTVEACL